MFADLMPIDDDYVLYNDFSSVTSRSEWAGLIENIHQVIHMAILMSSNAGFTVK